jgi:hypothetical protein
MSNPRKSPLVLLAIAGALVFPALAGAERGSGHGQEAEGQELAQRGPKSEERPPKGERPVSWNLKGVVVGKAENAETGQQTVNVLVKHSNRHGRALRNTEVTVDVTKARVVVRDVNGDGERNFADIADGDLAKIQLRLSRRHVFGDEPAPARRAIFKAPEAEEQAPAEQSDSE